MEVINSSGKKIIVSEGAISEMKQAYEQGVWGVLLKDIHGEMHSVIIPDNFGHGR